MKKELRFLSRKELIEIIYQLKSNEQELQKENAALKRQLEERRVRVQKAGSLAEASMALSGVFSSAQDAADRYLAEIEQRRKDVERDYRALMNHAREQAGAMLAEAEMKRREILREAKKAYAQLKRYEAAMEKIRSARRPDSSDAEFSDEDAG